LQPINIWRGINHVHKQPLKRIAQLFLHFIIDELPLGSALFLLSSKYLWLKIWVHVASAPLSSLHYALLAAMQVLQLPM
jgi:hypothetical protein